MGILRRAWTSLRRVLGPYTPLLSAYLVAAAFLFLSRVWLAFLNRDALAGTPDLWYMFPLGLRMDTVLLCQLLVLPALALAVAPAGRLRNAVIAAYFAICAAVIVMLELSTPSFIGEYDKRPDRIFIEYLIYPKELLATLWADYRLSLIGAPLVAGLAAWLGWRAARSALDSAPTWRLGWRLLALPLVLVVLVLGARSSLQKHPANISTASFSANRLANELALNSTYAVAYAARSMRNEVNVAALYGKMPWDEVMARVQRYSGLPRSAFADGGNSIMHRAGAAAVARPPNLVIILEESLGAGFVGHLGGLPLTPNLDRLSTQGMNLTRLYATGTRTARGMEAVVGGYPPSPSLAALKLPGAQSNFFTLGALLSSHGYATEFIYGGAANFDNMRGFLVANGFDRVIEERDFVDPVFAASWGLSDEDLMLRANDEFRTPRDRPFFALLLTSSNHEPFEIPAGRIEPYDQPLYSRANAIKYADYALGRFFDMARKEDYFANTVFLIVGDHDARVFGAPLVPVEHFHVPAVVIGPGVPVGNYDRLSSQIDLAPTLLDFLGIDAETPMPGRNLLRLPADAPGRAVMQYGVHHGFWVGDRIVVQAPHRPAETFRTDGRNLVPVEGDAELTRDALAHALWPYEVYRQKLYH